MNKILSIIVLSLVVVCCKQTNTTSEDNVKQTNNQPLKTGEYSNCFTIEDIKKISTHYTTLERIIKEGKSYDFSNSPISYTEQEKKWLIKKLEDKTCKGKIISSSKNCDSTITYQINCQEIIQIDDDEEHLKEEAYWDVLSKKNNKIFISDSGGAG